LKLIVDYKKNIYIINYFFYKLIIKKMKKIITWWIVVLLMVWLFYYVGFRQNNKEKDNSNNQIVSTPKETILSKDIITNIEEASYPIDGEALTTTDRIVSPISVPSDSVKLLPYEIAKYEENGYWKWAYGSGLDYQKRLDLMSPTYVYSGITNTARLLKFFTLTDIHLDDEESPSQAVYFGYKWGNSSAYSPVMLLTTQVLDAAVQTINAINKKDPIDFVISLWDVSNNSQHNELRWYIDVLDGKVINPDSGVKDDPIPWAHNDYQDEFKAAGLDKNIPWYQTLGNHDHFWMGSYPINDYIRKSYTGEEILNIW